MPGRVGERPGGDAGERPGGDAGEQPRLLQYSTVLDAPGFTDAARTWMCTSPGPGDGTAMSPTLKLHANAIASMVVRPGCQVVGQGLHDQSRRDNASVRLTGTHWSVGCPVPVTSRAACFPVSVLDSSDMLLAWRVAYSTVSAM